MRREVRLLLATAGGSGLDDGIRELAGSRIDWTTFLQLTALERASAVVAGRFDRIGAPLPDDVRRSLGSMATRANIRMATLSARLDATLAALAAAGIPVMLLKGAALGKTVYGSLARRPMLDIDLLVGVGRAAEARQVALASGWVASGLEQFAGFYEGHFHQAPLADAHGLGLKLELHTGLLLDTPQFDWPLEDVWAHSRELPGSLARVPSIEDLVLHLGLHFSWSHLARVGAWRTFRDLGTLADAGEVDWSRLVARAGEIGAGPACYWMLRLARACGVSAVPQAAERELRPPLAEPVLSLLERHFASQWYAMDAPCPSNRLDKAMWKLAMLPPAHRRTAVMPWDRDPAIRRDGASARETFPEKLLRSVGRLGGYARYVHRVAWGRAP